MLGLTAGSWQKVKPKRTFCSKQPRTHVPFTTSMRLLLRLLKRSKAQLRTKRLKPQPSEPTTRGAFAAPFHFFGKKGEEGRRTFTRSPDGKVYAYAPRIYDATITGKKIR